MEELATAFKAALGLTPKSLTAPQMILRGVVVYAAMVLLVRLGKKRFMGAATAFDVILGFMIGSIASRAVTGNAPFVPALAATAVLVLLHWSLSGLAMQWGIFGTLIKGHADVLIQNGRIDQTAVRKAYLSERDLWGALRRKGVSSLDEVVEARLERNGEVSVIRAHHEPEVLEVSVAEGVQTVRVELH